MKIKEYYFEDIFFPIKELWQKTYDLEFGNKKESFILSIGNDFDKLEYIVYVKNKKKYNELHRMMVFTTYGTITDFAIEALKNQIKILSVDDIPITSFEKHYFENLQHEGNEEYLKKYKGLKP